MFNEFIIPNKHKLIKLITLIYSYLLFSSKYPRANDPAKIIGSIQFYKIKFKELYSCPK